MTARTTHAWIVRGAAQYHLFTRTDRPHPAYVLALGPLVDERRRVLFLRGKNAQAIDDAVSEPRDPDDLYYTPYRLPVAKAPPLLVRDGSLRADGVATIPDEDLRRMALEDYLVLEEMLHALPEHPPFRRRVMRENPSRPVTKRDAGLASAARDKVLSPIGQWPWHQNERIERTQYEDVELYGKPKRFVLIWTSSENALGARKNGRLLIALNESANYIGAGAFFIEEYGRKCIQSVWVEPEYRQSTRHVRTGEPPGVDFGSILADMAKRDGIVCILKPISDAGAAWAKRHGLRVRA